MYAFMLVWVYAFAVRYTITFTGRVQGVGFRYTTVNIAQSYSVTGWVRNEPDGSVRCVAEGVQAELDRFVAAVKQSMSGYIADARIETAPATSEFNGFHVRR
jgi:acylphosphatase